MFGVVTIEDTFFAPAGRASPDELERLAAVAIDDPVVRAVLDATDDFVLVLDRHRQILAGNQAAVATLGRGDVMTLVGLRPGEAIACVNPPDGPDGCGTSAACRVCGAVLAILEVQAGHPGTTRECRLWTRSANGLEAMEFRVRATAMDLAGEPVVVCVFHDISAEKRRDVLEKIFLHDLNNTLGGLRGWTELMSQSDAMAHRAAPAVMELVDRLCEEIDEQRTLLAAERGDLKVRPAAIGTAVLRHALEAVFASHPVRGDRTLDLGDWVQEAIVTDRVLLSRVLVNMVKNALEATPAGGTVKASFARDDGRPTFRVRNAGRMPDDVAAQVFQRSFSTRGEPGRGLGTYSMRLLGERYLGGSVSFTTDDVDGTCFLLRLPA